MLRIAEVVRKYLAERGVKELITDANLLAKKAFITVYKPMAGYKAVHYWWNEELGGFHEPWNTGYFGYPDVTGAIEEAITWAGAEELPLYLSPEEYEALKTLLEEREKGPVFDSVLGEV